MSQDKEDFFSEVTVIFRCMNCKKEHTIHRYLTQSLRLEFVDIVRQGVKEGWSHPAIPKDGRFRYLCSSCKNTNKTMNYEAIQKRYDKEKKRLEKKKAKPETITSPRRKNELTVEEIENMAKGNKE